MFRRINLSATAIVLICFFLPWEQVSCGGAQDSVTGFDIARHDWVLLWLIPLSMVAVLVIGLLRRSGERPGLQAVVSLISAGVALYLMNDRRMKVDDAGGVIAVRLTGWFWLGVFAAGAVAISAIGMLFKRKRAPS